MRSAVARSARWLMDLRTLLQRGEPAVVCALDQVKGSAPRASGTAMVVSEDQALGTIGGGALEQLVIERARAMLGEGLNAERFTKPLGPEMDQCCGGHVGVLLRRMEPDALAWMGLPSEDVLSVRLPVTETEQPSLSTRNPSTSDDTSAMFLAIEELYQPVIVYGAGHVGRALISALTPLPFELTWVDGRDHMFPVGLSEGVTTYATPLPEGVARTAPANAYHLILTHSHALDLEIVAAVLERAEFGFLGLIGSKTKRATFQSALAKRGLSEIAQDRLICPIGLDGITDKRPEVIAASVAAQLLMLEGRTV